MAVLRGLRIRKAKSCHPMYQNAQERFILGFQEDGSVGGQLAGLIFLLFVIVAILGVLSYFHITLAVIEQWFRNFGLEMIR